MKKGSRLRFWTAIHSVIIQRPNVEPMKPLVSTAVLGLVPLPPAPDVQPAATREMDPGDCCQFAEDAVGNQELTRPLCNAGRMGLYALLWSAIWRRWYEIR